MTDEVFRSVTAHYTIHAGAGYTLTVPGPWVFLPSSLADAEDEAVIDYCNEHIEDLTARILYHEEELVEIVFYGPSGIKESTFDSVWEEPWHDDLLTELVAAGRPESVPVTVVITGPVDRMES